MKFTDLIVLSCSSRLSRIDGEGCIVPESDQECDINYAKYISQGLEIDLKKGLYRTRFGAEHGSRYIMDGFLVKDGWNRIGNHIITRYVTSFGDGLIGIYDSTNFKHLKNIVYDAVEAN